MKGDLTITTRTVKNRALQLSPLDPNDFYTMEPWTWITFEDLLFNNVREILYMFQFYGVKETVWDQDWKDKYKETSGVDWPFDVSHSPCFPIVLDFTGDHSQEHINIGEDLLDDSYSPGSIETWNNNLFSENIKATEIDYWSNFRYSTEEEIALAEAILGARGIFFQGSIQRFTASSPVENTRVRYPHGIPNIYIDKE